jgi:hypothetical protein
MTQKIQLRRDTAANWTSANPILAQGEVGYEIDTSKDKVGDGVTAWNLRPYTGVATAGWTQSGAGAVSRTVDSKLKDLVSVKDFGAVGDGTADDYLAITAAITASANKTLIFPGGTYSVSQTIVFDQSDMIVRGEGKVIITMPSNVHRDWSVANVGRSTPGVANAFAPVENVLIENITFDFNNNRRAVVTGLTPTANNGYLQNACTIANAKYTTVRNCRFLNGFRHCLDVTTPFKKNTDSLSNYDQLLQMPVLPNIGGIEVFGAQYITIDNCYFKGGGDDNLTTHYCSDVNIINCWSESPYGGFAIGGSNHNGFEIDDGSRNINISNCVAFKCMSGVEIKGHDYAPAAYNVTINGLRIINCSSSIEIHHTNWEGPLATNPNNAYTVLLGGSPGSIILAPGTPQQVACVDGISPMARNITVSDVMIVAPSTFSYHTRDSNNTFTPATLDPERCFEVGGYDGVLVSNLIFNDGRNDTALSDVDGYIQPVTFTGDLGLTHLHNGCRNVNFSNIHVTGFGGSSPLCARVFEITSGCFDAINCSNLTVVDGPNQIVEATGANSPYYGRFSGVVARSSITRTGPALDSSNVNLRFEQPDITGYTTPIDVGQLTLEKSASTPGTGRGIGSFHVNTTTGVVKTKTTGRTNATWQSLGALAWARYTGNLDIVRKSNNISSIVKNSTGNYTVTLSSDLVFADSNDFCVVVTSSEVLTQVTGPSISGSGQASVVVTTKNIAEVAADSGFINIVVYGETSN